MMDLMLSAQEKDFKEYCRKFAREEVIPIAEKYGETEDIPEEMVTAMAKAEGTSEIQKLIIANSLLKE